MRKIIGSFLLVTLCATVSFAQKGETKINIKYSVAAPLGSFRDAASNTSGRGFQAEILHGINDKVSVGFATGYQDFYDKKDRALYKLEDGSDISAVLSHSVQTVPLLASARYNFRPGQSIQPYAGLGVGGNLISYQQPYGQFGETQTKFGFAARPELGLYIPFSKTGQSGLVLGSSYSIMPYKNDEVNNLNHISFNLGLSLPLRR